MLKNLFTEFDKSCFKHNLYKLYTIGDCYVSISFMDSSKRNPAQEALNTVNFAFDMIDIIDSVRQLINYHDLNMRIGIHTGKIIGGVIGTEIVRYDIYGIDVIIANKMESSGQKGKIQISSATKRLIQDKMDLVNIKYNKQVQINEKIKIKTYFLEKINEFSLD